MFLVIHAGEMQKCQHIATDIFAFFPYHADFYADRWIEWDTGNIETGKFIDHAGVEKTATHFCKKWWYSGTFLLVRNCR